jgi:hypothetical protein
MPPAVAAVVTKILVTKAHTERPAHPADLVAEDLETTDRPVATL